MHPFAVHIQKAPYCVFRLSTGVASVLPLSIAEAMELDGTLEQGSFDGVLLLHCFSFWLLPCYFSLFSFGLSLVLFSLADCAPSKGVLNMVFTFSIVLVIVESTVMAVSLVSSDFYQFVIGLLMRNYLPYGFIETAQDGSLFVGEWFAQLCLRPLIWISQSPYNALAMSVVVVIAQTFLAIYALLRNMNYYDMNAPFLENFFNAVKGAALKLCTAILGEHAIDVLCKKKGE